MELSKQDKWDYKYMKMVYELAEGSEDPNTHLGAVIVGPDLEVISTGFNGLARGVKNKPERNIAPEKYFWYAHAERNAIYNAARSGVSTRNCSMYTPGTPCVDCAIGIIQSGIKNLILHDLWDHSNSPKWAESAKRSLEMFEEAGVNIRYVKGSIDLGIKTLRGGKSVW